MGTIGNFFTKTAVSAARSLILSEVKGGVKSFINKKRAKSIQDIHNEIQQRLGYVSNHYTVNQKTQEVTFKSSAVFVHEWLTNSSAVTEKIVRDEESGHFYIDGEPLSNEKKLNLINKFIEATGCKQASVGSHMENGLKLIELSDYNALKFKQHFAGWDASKPSIIDGWIDNCFGHILETDKAYAQKLFRKWIVGTARRAIKPGYSFDGCLVLTSPVGGVGKTLHFRNLLPEPFDHRTGEIICNVKQPTKFIEAIKGKTVACFDELSVLEQPRSEEAFKQLLSSQFIDVRLAWAREPRRYALRQGFCATTNKTKFITDLPLARRLWTIELNGNGRLNFEYLFSNRNALWQEAVHLACQPDILTALTVEEQKAVEAYNQKFMVNK